MKLTEWLEGRRIGTLDVPVVSASEVRPFSNDPDDPRRLVTVELLVPDGAALNVTAADKS